MPSNKLRGEVKVFIVKALACFDSPTVVAEAVDREFGIKVARQQIEKYDPTKLAGKNLSNKHRAIFDATRAAFLAATAPVGVAHRVVRLRALDRMAAKAEETGNTSLAMALLTQAAIEMGYKQ